MDDSLRAEMSRRNAQLLNYKRVYNYVIWDQDFPRTASLKIKRAVLAERLGAQLDRGSMVSL